MTEVVIHKLSLRIVRKGSFFWCSDPRSLARRALDMLPRLFAEELDLLDLREDRLVGMASPLRLHIHGTLDAFSASLAEAASPILLRSVVREALCEALAESASTNADTKPLTTIGCSELPLSSASALSELLSLYVAGELVARLDRTASGLIEAYHRLLLVDMVGWAIELRSVSDGELREAEVVIEALASGLAAGREPRDSHSRLRERILCAVGLAAQTGIHPFDARVRSLLCRLLPLDTESAAPERLGPPQIDRGSHASTEQTAAVQPPDSTYSNPQSEASARLRPHQARPRAVRAVAGERTAPILPLLGACLLTRSGGLRRVATHLDAIGRAGQLGLWVAGLAFKLGPAPWRGWRYPDHTWERVATIADYAVISTECAIHFADDPNADWDGLSRAMHAVLDGGDVSVTEGDMLRSRPACALAKTPQFDRHIEGVAAWSLFEIARALWPAEDSGIELAFDRLSSLDVQVRRSDEGLSIRVPLGKRHADLLHAGLLADVPNAPWLRDGASVRFRGA